MEKIALIFSIISLSISTLVYFRKHPVSIEPKTIIKKKKGAILFKAKTPEQQRRDKSLKQRQENNKDIKLEDLC